MNFEVQNLTKSFGEKEVLRDVSFSAQNGKALGLLGRNGAGKTTTIRIIMGVFYPDSGSVLTDGKPIDRNTIRIGYLPEERGLYPKKKIEEQLIYFGRLRGLSKKLAAENTARWLRRMDMSQYAGKPLETLSKGNQQKIQLVAALLCDPQLIILDEPFSGLDPVNAGLLRDVIKEMIDGGAAVIFSSHQMNYIEEFCDDIVILNSGKIAVSGSIKEIRRSYPRNNIVLSSTQSAELAKYLIRSISDIAESIMPDEKNDTVTVRLKNEHDKARLISELGRCSIDIDSFAVSEPTVTLLPLTLTVVLN